MASEALLHGPYGSPRVSVGDWISCEIRGLVQVKAFTNGPIPQPIKRGQGRAIIVCGDLVRALQVESASAVAHWWGVSAHRVSIWRAALGIDRGTEGTRALLAQNGNMEIAKYAAAGVSASLVPESRRKRDLAHAATMKGRPVDPRIGRKGGRTAMARRGAEGRAALAASGGKAAARRDKFAKRASIAKRFRTLGNIFRYERLRDGLVIDMRLAGEAASRIARLLGDGNIYPLLYDLALRYPAFADRIMTPGQIRRNVIGGNT